VILNRFLEGSSFSGLPQPRPSLPIHGFTGRASSTDWKGTKVLSSAPSVLTVSDLKINSHAIQRLSAIMRQYDVTSALAKSWISLTLLGKA